MPQAKKPKKSAKRAAKKAIRKAAKRPAKKAVKTKAKEKADPLGESVDEALAKAYILTARDRAFIKEYTQNGGNGTQAAIAVGMGSNENSSHVMAVKLLRSVTIQAAIEHCFSVAGLSERDVVQGYLEGFRAFKVTWVEDPTDTVNGGYRALMTPDFAVRQKNHDMYFKLTGKYPPQRIAIESDMGDVLRFLFNREDEKPLAPKMIELTEGDDGFDVPDGGSNGVNSNDAK